MSDLESTFTRRVFLERGMTLASMAATAPLFIQRSALGMMQPEGSGVSSAPGVPQDRILVMVQLGGGNDGLNTVVPYGSSLYYKARPGLAVPAPGARPRRQPPAIALDDRRGIGLHPSLGGFKALLDDGVASIIQGVGYPNPNRSHFTSMDIWHTADTSAKGYGWIGRYFDNTCRGTPMPDGPVAIGRAAPLAMQGAIQKPVTFESAELFRWPGADPHPALEQPYQQVNQSGALSAVDPDAQAGFLMRTALNAQVPSQRIRAAVARPALTRYPGGRLARQLRTVGAMIRDAMPTRVYYVTLGGFDTHAGQAGPHAGLLRQLGDALNAFYRDLKAQGNSRRVLTMVFSEFGRRVGQNASGGTDHGAAAPVYLVGDLLRPGLLGDHPSLDDLDQGDLRFNVDFRSVYAAILEDWMGAPAAKILGREYRRARIFRRPA
ncbi:MAG: DUF1501 domain-containing protein [Planctomycetota bacterium]|jgi:uncharacterized protein (DUF1501 family)